MIPDTIVECDSAIQTCDSAVCCHKEQGMEGKDIRNK